jgi:hypothetical protein
VEIWEVSKGGSHLLDARTRRQLEDYLGGFFVVVAPVTSQADGLPLGLLSQAVE